MALRFNRPWKLPIDRDMTRSEMRLAAGISASTLAKLSKCEAKNTVLRRIDPNAYYEHFYREAERLDLPIRLSDGGDFENEAQVAA